MTEPGASASAAADRRETCPVRMLAFTPLRMNTGRMYLGTDRGQYSHVRQDDLPIEPILSILYIDVDFGGLASALATRRGGYLSHQSSCYVSHYY
jgi:hypothetical protein